MYADWLSKGRRGCASLFLPIGKRQLGAERDKRAGKAAAHPRQYAGTRDHVVADRGGKQSVADDYSAKAKEMAAKWGSLAKDGDHFKLAFDKPGTWSQKYNLVWDEILALKLFPPSVKQTELAFYQKHLNQFGIPLDNRKSYTKLDWGIWTATLADSPDHSASSIKVHQRCPFMWRRSSPRRLGLRESIVTRY